MTWSTVTEQLCIKWPHSYLITGFVAKVRNTTNGTSGAGTACPLRAQEYITILLGYCVFCHSRYLVSDCLFDIFKFFSTFWNIFRKKYCCPRTIGKNLKYIRKLVYQDFKNCINVCPSVFAWSICKSPNQNLIAETS